MLLIAAVEKEQDRPAEGAFNLKDIWALRVRLQMKERIRELALFNFGITASCASAALSPQGPRRASWRAGGYRCHRHAAQNPLRGAVRDRSGGRETLQARVKQAGLKLEDFLFSKPASRVAPPIALR